MARALPADRLRRSVVALSAVVLSVLMPLSAAAAHSGGAAPNASLSAQGRVVSVELTAAPDDLANVGVALGLLPETAVAAYIGTGPVEDIPTAAQISSLSRSPALGSYLLERIQVRQDGVLCAGRAEPASDFIAGGARLALTCPRPIEQVEVRITVLHDRDPSYVTFGVDGTAWSAFHTAALPEHTWDATAIAGSRGLAPAVGTGAALIGVLTVSALGLSRLRRRPATGSRAS